MQKKGLSLGSQLTSELGTRQGPRTESLPTPLFSESPPDQPVAVAEASVIDGAVG